MSPIYQQGSSSCPRLNSLAVRFNILTPRLDAGQGQLKGTLKSTFVPSPKCILPGGKKGDCSVQKV